MTNILVVNSSPNPGDSVSRLLTGELVDAWSRADPGTMVVHRDVGLDSLPHIDQETVNAFYTPPDQRTAEQEDSLQLSDMIIEEVESADVVVIGSPMHNFSITSGLKAWIDQLARVGRTFNYTDKGPVGALGGRKVYVITARGGSYGVGSPAASMDMQEPYLRTVLGFVGLNDVEFVHAEGMAGGTEGVDVARENIRAVIPGPTTKVA